VPRYALYALLIFTPLARASVQGWAISIINLVTLLALTALLLEKTLTWEWQWIKTPLDWPILILLILVILSAIFSMHRYTSLWAFILLLNYITIYYLVIHTVKTRSQVRHLFYVIIGVAALLTIIGLLKILCGNPFPWWDYTAFQYNPNRLSATFGNANHLAGYMEMAIPLLLGFLITGLRGGRLFLMNGITFFLFLSLILSLSRGGWFGAFAGLFFMAFALLFNRYFESKRLVIALACIFFVVVFIVLSSTVVVKRIRTVEKMEDTPSLSSRATGWAGIVKMIKDHPLFGTGPGTFAVVFTQYQPSGLTLRYFNAHNDYLQVISEAGLPIIPIIGWMIIAFYRKGFEKLNNPSRLVRGTTIGAMSGVTAILIHGIFDFNLYVPANALLFTVLAAIVVLPVPTPDKPEFRNGEVINEQPVKGNNP